MAKKSSPVSSEKVKRMALFALGGILVVVIAYRFFLSGPESKPKTTPPKNAANAGSATQANAGGAAVPKPKPKGAAAEQEAIMQALLADVTPLNLKYASSGSVSSKPDGRGNIFAYFVEPPPPPPPPPLPPPIQLVSVQPSSAVAGTPRPITLVVRGNKLPADAQIILEGSPRPTKRINDSQLSTDISPGDYSLARGMKIEVKSQSDPKMNSNDIQFMVQPAPEPQFIYKGRLGPLTQPQANYALIELNSTKEIKRAKVGDTVMGNWRVDKITAEAIELTHTQYDIKRRVNLQERPK